MVRDSSEGDASFGPEQLGQRSDFPCLFELEDKVNQPVGAVGREPP